MLESELLGRGKDMSVSFGPIHQWLFDQIRLVDLRTEELLEHLSKAHSPGDELLARERLRSEFGEEIGNKGLQELVVPPFIHQGLSELIARIESRESAAVSLFDGASNGLVDLYERHGAEVGTRIAPEIVEAPTAPEIFEALQQVKLVGMPCDNVVEVVDSRENSVLWRQSRLLQVKHWHAGGSDLETMFRLHGRWIEGFARALNHRARHGIIFFRPESSPASEELLAITDS